MPWRILIRLCWLLLPHFMCAGEAMGSAQPADAASFKPDFSSVLFQRGDDPRWAATDLDDSKWSRIGRNDLPARDGIYWIRIRVNSEGIADLWRKNGLQLRVVASYDLYWDGQLIGRNGRVAARREDETPGLVDALFQLPESVLGGAEHVIALRMSSFHTGFPGPTYGLTLIWGNFREMIVGSARLSILSVLTVGGALVVAIVFGLMWLLTGRRWSLLWFSLLFLCIAVMQGLQAWRWLFEYPYDWHYPRVVAIASLVMAMAALLPIFVVEHFRIPRRRWIIGCLLAALAACWWFGSPVYNRVSISACGVGFEFALILVLRAAWQRRRGALFAALGLGISTLALAAAPREFLEHSFFLSAGPAVLGLLVAQILQLRDERREAQQAVLTAARLETELLKKNLQPHFLLNTLATIMEVIEQEPKTAVKLIDALAGEFRILSRVSGEKLIPLAEELELCRAHLEVMSLRKGAACALSVEGAAPDAMVPPALFHTLIENGLTHLLPRDGRIEFALRIERRAEAIRFILRARGRRQEAARRPPAQEGTGLRYIRARLAESFGAHGTMAGGPVAEGWETVIELKGPPPAVRRAVAAERAPGLPENSAA